MKKRFNQLFSCEFCNHSFNTTTAGYSTPIYGVTFGIGFAVWCLDKFRNIRKTLSPDEDLQDRLIACPYCGNIHIKEFKGR